MALQPCIRTRHKDFNVTNLQLIKQLLEYPTGAEVWIDSDTYGFHLLLDKAEMVVIKPSEILGQDGKPICPTAIPFAQVILKPMAG